MLFVCYWFAFGVIFLEYHPQTDIKKLPIFDAVIVFGTLVEGKTVSPLLKERLDAALALYRNQKIKEIVVSNTPKAACIMHDYLIKHQVPASVIKLDIQANTTPDTCKYEKRLYPKGRKLIFVSQGFHLPRINYQCKKMGLNAALFPAEILQKRISFFSSFEVMHIRTGRYFREAGLTLLAVLHLY